MLHTEKVSEFIVYPSWAEMSATWEDLPRLFADPRSGEFLPQGFDTLPRGWTDLPHELIDGPAGGGIIKYQRGAPGQAWTPLLILTYEANLRAPNGMDGLLYKCRDACPVLYIEPTGVGWRLGVAKKPRNIRPGLSLEHAEAAGDNIYWVVRYRGARKTPKEIKGLSSLPAWAGHFGLDALALPHGPAEALRLETQRWFTNPENESAWFEISGDGDGVGFHLAVVVYIGNHLRWVGGPRVRSMHLVAQIEGKPNVCSAWTILA
jgi:hypothetical protein